VNTPPAEEAVLRGPVVVVGAGLLGTSIGLALRARGLRVLLDDLDPQHLRTATGLGAGVSAREHADEVRSAQLVVVAVPPDHLGEAVVRALRDTTAVVTDVGSVKSAPLAAVADEVAAAEVERYVGSHPMAGSERSGPLAASATLFEGRPWALAPHPQSSPEAVALVEALVAACGAQPFTFDPAAHDEAVARTSHLPHVVAALVAGRLSGAPPDHLALSGQGVRDVTRIAAGDPAMWEQILTANTSALTDLLRELRGDLDVLLDALDRGSRDDLRALLAQGVAGTAAIPGKHGGPPVATVPVYVALPDHPGELGRLFGDVGESGVNVEDVRIDHDPGRPVGQVELRVAEGAEDVLLAALQQRGWTVHG
jgi:prephenate dehydrogenase